MPAPRPPASALSRLIVWSAPPLVGLMVLVLLLGPRASTALIVLLGLFSLAWPTREPRGWRAFLLNAPTVAAVLFGSYLAINALWAVDRWEAIGKVALYFACLVAIVITVRAFAGTSAETLGRSARAAVAGFAAAVLFLLLEELTDHLIKRQLFSWLSVAPLTDKHMTVDEDGLVRDIRAYTSNRNMALLALVLWPALLATSLYYGARMWPLRVALFLAATMTVAPSEHETSVIALALSLVAFTLARAHTGAALGLVAAAWVGSTLLVVPLVSAAYRIELHRVSWLPHTATQRIILWGYTAEQIGRAPWLGVGIASTKVLDARRGDTVEKPPGYTYPRRTGPHAHNIYLQTWYELGAVGALLLLGLGGALLRAIAGLPSPVMPYALATFVSAATVGAFSWGLWQAWFMAAFGLTSVLAILMTTLAHMRANDALEAVASAKAQRLADAGSA